MLWTFQHRQIPLQNRKGQTFNFNRETYGNARAILPYIYANPFALIGTIIILGNFVIKV
jgi:hypothetical protein